MIIVVGGGGFLGRNLRRELASEAEVVVVAADRPGDRAERLSPTETIIDEQAFAGPAGDALIASAAAIVYLATRSVPATFARDPASELGQNVEPSTRFFMRCVDLGSSARVILSSSGGTIYGGGHSVPIPENAVPQPISAYGLGKLLMEESLRYVGRAFGLRYTILRISNAVGRFHRRPDQGVIPIALRLARDGGTLVVRGDGLAVRDYVDAADVSRAIAMACAPDAPDARVWNVSRGEGHALMEVVRLVERVSGRELRVAHTEASGFDLGYAVLDRAVIARELGWEPRISLEETVARVWSEEIGPAA